MPLDEVKRPGHGGRTDLANILARRASNNLCRSSDRVRIVDHMFEAGHAIELTEWTTGSHHDVSADIPRGRLAAVAITRGPEYLTVFNGKWGVFTLPMTKRRTWSDPRVPASDHEEEPLDAAIRAAAEALGRPLAPYEFPRAVEPGRAATVPAIGPGRALEELPVRRLPSRSRERRGTAPVDGVSTAWLTLDGLRSTRSRSRRRPSGSPTRSAHPGPAPR